MATAPFRFSNLTGHSPLHAPFSLDAHPATPSEHIFLLDRNIEISDYSSRT